MRCSVVTQLCDHFKPSVKTAGNPSRLEEMDDRGGKEHLFGLFCQLSGEMTFFLKSLFRLKVERTKMSRRVTYRCSEKHWAWDNSEYRCWSHMGLHSYSQWSVKDEWTTQSLVLFFILFYFIYFFRGRGQLWNLTFWEYQPFRQIKKEKM